MMQNLKEFARNARGPDAGFRFIVNAANASEATVRVYGDIGFFGINSDDFARALDSIPKDVKTIHVRVDSRGGDVFDAITMANALRNHPATIVSHIDGLAASAASYFAMSADEVRMGDNTWIMIHDPWSGVMGTARDMRKSADLLDRIGATITDEYTKRVNVSREQVVAWMADETWLNANDALKHGFVDAIDDGTTETKNKFDLSVFAKVPDALKFHSEKSDDSRSRDVPEISNKRAAEKALRDAGFSLSEAKRIVTALGDVSLNQREADENTDAFILASNALLATLQFSQPNPNGPASQRAA